MTTNERIKKIRVEFCNDCNIEFANRMGEKRQTVNNWVRNGYSVGDGVLYRILEKFPTVNRDWLIDEKGEMLKQSSVVQTGDQNINVSGTVSPSIGNISDNHGGIGQVMGGKNTIISGSNNRNIGNISTRVVDGVTGDLTAENTKGIPLIPFDFIAGYGEDNAGISLNDCDRYIIPEFEHIGAEFLVRVGGSSMYPKYSSGDILACKKIHDILFFQWGKIYVIDSSQGQLIKRIFEHENEELIMLVSDNKEKYPPFSIPKNDIRSLSIVLGVVRME